MALNIALTNATRNQATATYTLKKIFIFDNRFIEGTYKNQSGASMTLQSGMLAARAAGTYETAAATFGNALTTGQTMIIAGLTYTSTAATTTAQLAAAFANLDNGATTGAGTLTGTYSGALTAYSSGPASGSSVTFTAETVGNKTDLTATGTGTSPTFVIVSGTSTTGGGFIPVTSANLADTIGITATDGAITLPDSESSFISVGTKGGIDGGNLTLPSGVTLDTVVGNKTLRDILEALGFHIGAASVEQTKAEQ